MSDFEKNISDAREFGKVAVLMGGDSAERDISLKSGERVLAGLRQAGIDAHPVDARGEGIETLRGEKFARVFNVLHGRGGEDGVIQGALEAAHIPYTGSGVLGCALSMDKVRTKLVWDALGLPSPEYGVVQNDAQLGGVLERIEPPWIVKPSREGSSIGMTKVVDEKGLREAYQLAAKYDASVLIEKWIEGPEYTTGVLRDRALPLIRLATPRTFYDYEAKYFSDTTVYECPCGLPAERELELADLCLDAFYSVDASGWGRVDFMCDEQGQPWLLEVNTVPGMTDHSLVPMAAKAIGIEFSDLLWLILEDTFITREGKWL